LPYRSRRIILFVIAILAGIGFGMFLGYEVIARPAETNAPSLRIDFKTDYALMVSELYAQEGDAAKANARMTYLGESSPLQMLQTAIAYAQEVQYDPDDIQRMLNLAAVIQVLPEGTQ